MTKPKNTQAGALPPLAEEIARLRAMTTPELVPRYTELFGKPPRSRHRAWLWKRCAWKIQEQRLGGLGKKAKDRLEELIASIEIPMARKPGRVVAATEPIPKKSRGQAVSAGTTITRVWHDTEYRVRVTDEGVEVLNSGVRYRSLTAAAHAITGQHWNGPLFFGLRERSRRS